MSQFRLTQISDTHLGRRFPKLIQNFDRIAEHIDATRPRSRDQLRRSVSTVHPCPRILGSQDPCMIHFRSPAAIFLAITTS